MKHLTIRISFDKDTQVIPDCLMLDKKLGGGIITASARYDLFECQDIAEEILNDFSQKYEDYFDAREEALEKINKIVSDY